MPFVMMKPDQRARLKPCLRCGYSLRNNIDARNCPECGLAVRISLANDDSLHMSNPAWLRRLAWGAAVFLAANILAMAAMFGMEAVRRTPGLHSFRVQFYVHLVRASDIMLGVSFLVGAAAALPLGSAEGRHPDRTRGARLAVRVLAPCCALLGGLLILPRVANVRLPFELIRWLAPPAAVLTAAAAWATLHDPVRRAGARRAAGWIPVLGVGLVVGCAMGLLAFGSALLIALRLAPWIARSLPLTIALLVYFPVAITILTRCWLQFRVAAREAEQNWVSDPG
jgi:hypothetical protein